MEAVKVAAAKRKVLTLDQVLTEIERDETYEQMQMSKLEDAINHKEFIVGIVPFALGKTEELIQMAFELYTNNASDRVTPMDLRFILMTLNTVASYFGDPVMTVAQVDKVVDDAADKLDPPPKSGELLMAELSPYVADHEFVHEFVEGKGTSRYGNKL